MANDHRWGPKPVPRYPVDRPTAIKIFNSLTLNNKPTKGIRFPVDVVVRFYGDENINFYETEGYAPKMRPIHTTEEAAFTNKVIPDTNGE